jgi:NAD(P)H-hydrate epimerase
MSVPVLDQPADADLVIDALIGYSLHGDPGPRFAELITWANSRPSPMLALDTPSGLDVTTGRQSAPCVRASATMTLALPKTGLAGSAMTGRLYLADISVPLLLLERMGLAAPGMFRDGPVVELQTRPGPG